MSRYQARVLRRHGFRTAGRAARRSSARRSRSPTCSARAARAPPDRADAFAALPRYFSQNVITADRRTANIAFGIRSMPLDEQKQLIDDMRAQLDPPPGVDAELAGLPVLAADANAELESSAPAAPRSPASSRSSSCCWPPTGGRGGARYRSCRSRSRPAGPRCSCSLLQIPLNPMSATLGALVIAISTEFAVLLSAATARSARQASSRRPRWRALTSARGGGARLEHHGDRWLRRAARQRLPHAARLRRRDGRETSPCPCWA